jgi:hypothetical protein
VPLTHSARRGIAGGSARVAAALLMGLTCMAQARAAETENTGPAAVAPKRGFFAIPPVSLRVAPELLIAPKLQQIPLEAYGFSAAIGPRFDVRGFDFTPALALDMLWGETENGLDFTSTALSLDCEFTVHGKLDWLHLALGFGHARNHVARATTPNRTLSETVPNAHVLLSADVLRVSRFWAFWIGGGVRFVGAISAPVVMLGGRI